MAGYRVRFVGHLLPYKCPAGFPTKDGPKEVYTDVYLNVETTEQVRDETNRQSLNFVRYQGMIVLKDPDKMWEEGGDNLDARWFIPMAMLSHISVQTTRLTTDIPGDYSEGWVLQ